MVAFCSGHIVEKRWVSGYGGVIVQWCSLDGESVTVIYGHLNILSVEKNIGDELIVGEQLGLLGDDKSTQTDGERKHLHFGIYKGNQVNLKGYVQTENELSAWIDPMIYLNN